MKTRESKARRLGWVAACLVLIFMGSVLVISYSGQTNQTPIPQHQLPLSLAATGNPEISYSASAAQSNAIIAVVAVNALQGDDILVSFAFENGSSAVYISTVFDNESDTWTQVLNDTAASNGLSMWMTANLPASQNGLKIKGDCTEPCNVTTQAEVIHNANRISPVDVSNSAIGTSTTPSVLVTTTKINELVVGALSVAGRPTISVSGPPYYILVQGSPGTAQLRGATIYADHNSTGAFAVAPTLATSRFWIEGVIAIAFDPTPLPPTSLAIGSITATTVALTWSNPPGTLTNDTVFSGRTTTGPWIYYSTGGAATSYTVTGLACDNTYIFQVEADNSSGSSIPSNQVSATTPNSMGCVVALYGNQSITTAVSYVNKTVNLYGGNITCTTGGSLLFDNATFLIKQNNTGGAAKSPVNNGIIIRNNCALTVKYSTIGTNSTPLPSYPTYINQAAGATGQIKLIHSLLEYLGWWNGTKSTTGINVDTPHVVMAADTFSYVHTLYFTGSFTGSSITGSTLTGGTYNDENNATIFVDHTAAWFNMTNDTIITTARNMPIFVDSANHTMLGYDNFTNNISTSGFYDIQIAANGASTGETGSFSTVTHTMIENSGVEFKAQNDPLSTGGMRWLNFTWNNVTSTPTHGTRSSFEVYFDGSTGNAGEQGIFVRHVLVQHNSFSNWTGQDALRLGTNISFFNISYNHMFNLATGINPSVNGMFSYAIYLIRGVSNGTVYDNVMNVAPLFDGAPNYIASYGVQIEAHVFNVNVSDNVVFNFTAVAYVTQGGIGSYDAPTWYKLPDSNLTEYKNVAENFHSVNDAAKDNQECFLSWDGANGSKWIGNYCRYDGWSPTPNPYNGFAFHISAQNNYIANNTAVNCNGFAEFGRNAANSESPGTEFHVQYNTLTNNTWSGLTLTYGAAIVSDTSSGWTLQNNNISGNLGLSPWSFAFVNGPNGTSSFHLLNTYLTYLNTSSVFYGKNLWWYGPATILNIGVQYHFNLTRWNVSTATVTYGGMGTTMVGTPFVGNWYNVTVTSYASATGAINWTGSLRTSLKAYFNVSNAMNGNTYTFLVDGVQKATLVASGNAAKFIWSTWTSHNFVIASTLVLGVPNAPTGLHSTAQNQTTITLSWTAPAGLVLNYTIYYGTNCGSLSIAVSTGGILTTFTITGLLPQTLYCAAVTAWNATGQSAQSITASDYTGAQNTTTPPCTRYCNLPGGNRPQTFVFPLNALQILALMTIIIGVILIAVLRPQWVPGGIVIAAGVVIAFVAMVT